MFKSKLMLHELEKANEFLARSNELLADLNGKMRDLQKALHKRPGRICSIKDLRSQKAAEEALSFIENNAPTAFMFDNGPDNLRFIMKKMLREGPAKGLYLEFGVFKGGSINLCAKILPGTQFYGFDSFEGLPEDWIGNTHTSHVKGYFTCNGIMPEVRSNVTLTKGWFDETLPLFLKEHEGPVSFLHVDCDLFSSTKTILENLRHRITVGTIIVFDEFFNYPNWQLHEYKAFMEFVSAYDVKYEFISFGNMQATVKITGNNCSS